MAALLLLLMWGPAVIYMYATTRAGVVPGGRVGHCGATRADRAGVAESAVTRQLIDGEIAATDYRQAMEHVAAQDARTQPLYVPER